MRTLLHPALGAPFLTTTLLLLGCEAVPELEYRTADAAVPAPASSSDVDAGADDDTLGSQIAVILDGDDAGDVVSDAASRSRLYDRVCNGRPRTPAFCCGAEVLCAGKAKRCVFQCPDCVTKCPDAVCCILKEGTFDHCSNSKKECAAALRSERDR